MSSDSDGEPLVDAMEHSEGQKRKIKFQRRVQEAHTTCTQLLASELQSSVWLNIWCQPPPFHSKTNWTAASSRRWGDITPAASWLVVFCRCGPTGCSSNHDAPVRSHGCRMKCHRRPHSQGAGLVCGLCGPHVQISGKWQPPPPRSLPSLGFKKADWLRQNYAGCIVRPAEHRTERERRENLHI